MLRTARLRLFPVTPALARADLAGPATLGEALGTAVPASWPPEHMDHQAIRWTLDQLGAGVPGEWLYHYIVREDLGGARTVGVGTAGFTGVPDAEGTVEVGYSVVPEHRRAGVASEAVAALMERAFDVPAVERIIAHTHPGLLPSIGVLVKNGYHLVGAGTDPGVLRYAISRADHDAGRTWTPPHVRTLARLLSHMCWADAEVHAALATEPMGSRARQVYDHILGAESRWLTRLRQEAPAHAVWPTFTPGEAAGVAAQVAEGLRAFLWQLAPADLDRLITYRTSDDVEQHTRVEDILLHLFLHGAYHRGQVASLLRGGGATPPATDFIGFVRGVPAARTDPPPAR